MDARADGGIVILPPSSTATGYYRVETHLPLAAAPDWLVALFRSEAKR